MKWWEHIISWQKEYNPIEFPSLGLKVDPISDFTLFSTVKIHMYGVIIGIGLLLAVIYGLRRAKQFGLTQDHILDGVLCILPVAIICARLYYCIMEWQSYASDPVSVLYIWKGGLAIYGGVIGAVIGVMVFCRVKRISLGATLDLVCLGFLIGQAIGRWGNFFNREAFGCYSDGLLAMRISAANLSIPKDASAWFLSQYDLMQQMAQEGGYMGIQVHPTFLYESLWNAAGFVILHFLSKKRKYDGQIALGYAAWYGAGRAIIEGLRMDSLYLGAFRISQLLAAVSCAAAVGVLIWQAFRSHDEKDLFVNKITAQEAEEKEVEENE